MHIALRLYYLNTVNHIKRVPGTTVAFPRSPGVVPYMAADGCVMEFIVHLQQVLLIPLI